MPKKEDDKPVVLHPMTFEDALKRMLKTRPVSSAKSKARPTTKGQKQKKV